MSNTLQDVLQMQDMQQQQEESLTTLEALHQNKMKHFENHRDNLVSLRSKFEDLEYELHTWPEYERYSEEHKQKMELLDDHRKEIVRLEKDEDRLSYFLDVGGILFEYYDAQDKIAKGNDTNEAKKKMKTPINSVLSYFQGSTVQEPFAEQTSNKPLPAPATNIELIRSSIVNSSSGLNRDKLLEKYLSIVDPKAIKSGIMPGSGINPEYGCCPFCELEMIFYHNEAMLGCPKCGYQDFILIDSEKPSYKDPPREISYFAYKKINHFNEWLAQFQAKESTEIPNDVFQLILSEIKKERIKDPRTIKPTKLRHILKKLNLNRYYGNVPHILHRLNVLSAPTMSREMEDKLRFMFKEIQPSFIRHCPKGRSNFLSYSYVLYKFCQLLELDEFLPCFPLLKSHEKLYMQDKIWQKICTDMSWEFIRTI